MLSGFELYPRWVPLSHANCIRATVNEVVEFNMSLQYVLFNSVSTFMFRRDSIC